MGNKHSIERAVVVGLLGAGSLFFGMAVTLSGRVPVAYRNTSPGFGWSWDFNSKDAIVNAGRLGELPMPWPATEIGDRWLLPLDQPLDSKKLRITYRGETEPGRFRLDVVIKRLDPDAVYPREFSVHAAKRGFRIADQSYVLKKITPLYIHLQKVD